MIQDWYKDGYYWKHVVKDGSDGKGDLIFNTMYKILQDEDESDWAYCALESCANLLLDGKRWPDRMNGNDADSWLERIVSMWLMKLGLAKNLPFRYQGRMTRDPFIALYTVALFLEEPGYIQEVPMPWYIYSRNTWRWRRRLINDSRKTFIKRLGYLRAKAVTLKFEL